MGEMADMALEQVAEEEMHRDLRRMGLLMPSEIEDDFDEWGGEL